MPFWDCYRFITGGAIGDQWYFYQFPPVTIDETFGDHRWNYRWTTDGPPVATAKAADATSVVHRWDSGGSSVTTGGLRLVSNPGDVVRAIST